MAKIGAGALGAALRQGPKELAQILPAFNDGIKPIEEPGAVGNLVPSEVLATKDSFEAEVMSAADRAAKAPAKEREADLDMG